MIRGVRRLSSRSVPHETQPRSKYNVRSSAFNIKPVPTQGLVFNPPASMPSANNTPRAFLPPGDPRVERLREFQKSYTPEEVANMPLIYGIKAEKEYNVTPDVVAEVRRLREEDPAQWTVNKLARKFGISRMVANVITQESRTRQSQIKEELAELKKSWPLAKSQARIDRRKRVQMWLRNEF